MARIFIDGFESGDLGLWTTFGAAIAGSVSGMSGSYCLLNNSNGQYTRHQFPSPKAEIYVALKYRPTGASSVLFIGFMDATGASIMTITRNGTTGYLSARIGDATVSAIVTAVLSPLSANTTYLVEIYYKPLNSAGVIQVKVDGVQVIDYSGDTTLGNESIQLINLGYVYNSQGYGYYDDVVIDDANWIGNTKITALVPTGAGATSAWDGVVDAHPSVLSRSDGAMSGPYLNIRQIIPASYITQSGSKIKIGFYAYTNQNTNVIGCSIGLRNGSTDDFSGTPTRVTLGGSNSFTIAMGSTMTWSDWITFSLDDTADHLVHLYLSGGGTIYVGYNSLVDESGYWKIGEGDETDIVSVSGYTAQANRRYCVFDLLVEKTDGSLNYSTVDEYPASDYDYIFTNTENAIDTYALGNIIGGVPITVAVQSRLWKEGRGAVNRIKHIVRPSSTNREGDSHAVPISAGAQQTIWNTNPDDDSAWSASAVNGMEIGVKAVTT